MANVLRLSHHHIHVHLVVALVVILHVKWLHVHLVNVVIVDNVATIHILVVVSHLFSQNFILEKFSSVSQQIASLMEAPVNSGEG